MSDANFSKENIEPPYDVALPKITPEIWEAYQDEEFIEDSPRWEWTQAAVDFACEIVRPAVRAEIERLKRGNEILRDELAKIDALHDSVESERDRLRAALEKIANGGICGSHETHFECPQSEDVCAIARAALSGEPGSAVETGTCQDEADAKRYRWLKAEDRKPMPLATISWRQRSNQLPCKLADNDPLDALIDAAIASPEATVEQVYRTAVEATPHRHTDECWEPDSGCDMGRSEAHAIAVPRCEYVGMFGAHCALNAGHEGSHSLFGPHGKLPKEPV